MKSVLQMVLSISALTLLSAMPAFAGWRDVRPGDFVSIPRDLYFKKDYRIQWWYVTGHLFDAHGREFGYELTFFGAGVQQRVYESKFGVDFIYLSHFAVSDISGSRFYHLVDADSGAYGFSGAEDKQLRVWVERSLLEGSEQEMHIRAVTGNVEIDMRLIPEKPFVLHGDRGYSRKSEVSPFIASLYFSFTRLRTTGTMKVGKGMFQVTGKSWFDREISSRGLAPNETGWDWFALQLDDDREIMLYEIRKKDGSLDPFSSGTVVYRDGSHRHLDKKDFTVNILSHYTSRHTRARYPSKWEVVVPSEKLKLEITPLLQDQEFTSAGAIKNTYWEGTCRIDGTVRGRAYVEMTGY